ncbi:MAG: TatD family hydrolase [Candidatus Falkowbacteria bacterium]
MQLIDTHCHINLQNYKDDADDTIKRALEASVGMIIVGTDYKSSKKALDLANRYQKDVNVAVGLHPESLEDRIEKWTGQEQEISGEVYNAVAYQQLAKFPKVVAIGEIGLDYFRPDLNKPLIEDLKDRQKKVFWQQLELALLLKLPVIIHCRQAHDDLLEMLTDFKRLHKDLLPALQPWGVIHCFSGSEQLAWRYFALDMCISFTGLVTFSQQWDSLIKKMPSDRLLLETDAPFLTPEPYRGKRNEPILVKYVADRVAAIRGVSVERVAEFTTDNSRRLFKL